MTNMRAVLVGRFGGPETLDVTEVPLPEPGPGQVRIKVAAAAVNPVDLFTRAGQVPIDPDTLPVGLGWDAAGSIDAVGAGVSGLAGGDAVIAFEDHLTKPLGPYAEYLVVDADAVAPAPRTVDATAAATLPLNATTAAQALDLADLPSGSTLLIAGAAGAVGGYAVQLAAARGLRVVALAGAGDEADVRAWGAEMFVPRSDDIAPAVRATFPDGVDAALDTVYQPADVLGAVRNGGVYINLTPPASPVATERGIRALDQIVHRDSALLAELSRLVDAGRLTLRVAETFPLAEVAAAHELAGKSGVRGRVVLIP
ncbi:MAG TPA: NADP-dependent oxidoreductase [Jatrophihabitantaceae bacterium]